MLREHELLAAAPAEPGSLVDAATTQLLTTTPMSLDKRQTSKPGTEHKLIGVSVAMPNATVGC